MSIETLDQGLIVYNGPTASLSVVGSGKIMYEGEVIDTPSVSDLVKRPDGKLVPKQFAGIHNGPLGEFLFPKSGQKVVLTAKERPTLTLFVEDETTVLCFSNESVGSKFVPAILAGYPDPVLVRKKDVATICTKYKIDKTIEQTKLVEFVVHKTSSTVNVVDVSKVLESCILSFDGVESYKIPIDTGFSDVIIGVKGFLKSTFKPQVVDGLLVTTERQVKDLGLFQCACNNKLRVGYECLCPKSPKWFKRDVGQFGYHDAHVIVRHMGSNLRVGIEVEKVDSDIKRDYRASSLFNATGWVLGSDGTVSEGYELVSPVLPLDRKFIPELTSSIESVAPLINGSWNERCGGHIHVSRSSMDAKDLVKTIDGYIPVILALYWNRVNSSGYASAVKKGDSLGARGSIHISRLNTIEFRAFSAIKNVENLMWRLELLRLIFENPETDHIKVLELVTDLSSPIGGHIASNMAMKGPTNYRDFIKRLVSAIAWFANDKPSKIYQHVPVEIGSTGVGREAIEVAFKSSGGADSKDKTFTQLISSIDNVI